eukprot:6210348-Prymnesium_polylepis.2
MDAPTADEAVRELQAAQERATAEELMARMRGRLDPAIAAYLLHDALGGPAEPEGLRGGNP